MDVNCSTMEAKKARNGVGICVRNHQDKVLEVYRSSDSVTAVKIVLSDNVWNTIKGALYIIWCGVNRLGDSVVKVV